MPPRNPTCLIFAAALLAAGCDGQDETVAPNSGSNSHAEVSRKMFEANAAEQRGDTDLANSLYLELCLDEKHVEACTELEDEAESDPELKRKLCHQANHTPAC